eukprot:15481603-Alexandrium_andersonii.AAC.1
MPASVRAHSTPVVYTLCTLSCPDACAGEGGWSIAPGARAGVRTGCACAALIRTITGLTL